MAVVTRERPAGSEQARGHGGDRAATLLVLLAAAAVALLWLWPAMVDPTWLPPGPDMAWYTWRAELLSAYPPSVLVLADGPLSVFGGGYRVTTATLAALLGQVGDVDRTMVSILLIPGRQVVLALALGAVAYRLRPEPLVFAATALVSAIALFLRPFVGYVDNVIALLLAAGAIWFLRDARTRWPARIAVFAFTFLLPFTHPPTAVIFAGVFAGTVAARAALRRSVSDAVRTEGWMALAGVAGPVLGYGAWLLGMWGPGRTIRNAMHIPPYPSTDFLDAAIGQVRALQLTRLLPLVVIGILVLVRLTRGRLGTDPMARGLLVWLAPLVGILGFYIGLRYPYKRFLNSTVAPMILAGLGLWAVIEVSMRSFRDRSRDRRWWRPVAGGLGIVLVAGLVLTTWANVRRDFEGQDPWVPVNLRISTAAVRTYLEQDPTPRPLVFVISAGRYQSDSLVWGGVFRGNWSQVRSGLPGEVLPRTHVFVGAVRDFVEDRPTVTGNRLVDLISVATLQAIRATDHEADPLVVLVKRFNRRLGNDRYLRPPHSISMGGGVYALSGPDFAVPEENAVRTARAAAAREERFLIGTPDRWPDPGRVVRVLAGLVVLLLLPGLLAARWLGIHGLATRLGMVPVVSIAMNVLAAFVVLAVVRRPLTAGLAWVVAGMAVAVGAALHASSRRRAALAPAEPGGEEQQPAERQG